MFPDGLANSSGQVGRNYMRHMTGSVYAVFDKPVHMYRGTTMAGIVQDEAGNDPKRGFVGGYELETLSLGLPFMAAFLNPGAWGRSFTTAHRRLSEHGRACGSSARTCRRRPTGSRSIRRRRTQYGMPVASVHYDDHPNDIAMRNHAYQQGARDLRRGRRDAHVPDAALSQHPQPGHQPDERQSRATASSTNTGRRTTSRTCSSRTAASSPALPAIRR